MTASLAATLAWVVAVSPPTQAHRVVVEPGGAIATLTEGLRRARPGDTIVVRTGVYREPRIVIAVPVTILGEGDPVFDGEGAHEVLTVKADGVVIRDLTVRNVG